MASTPKSRALLWSRHLQAERAAVHGATRARRGARAVPPLPSPPATPNNRITMAQRRRPSHPQTPRLMPQIATERTSLCLGGPLYVRGQFRKAKLTVITRVGKCVNLTQVFFNWSVTGNENHSNLGPHSVVENPDRERQCIVLSNWTSTGGVHESQLYVKGTGTQRLGRSQPYLGDRRGQHERHENRQPPETI